jgi:hypothetical protein
MVGLPRPQLQVGQQRRQGRAAFKQHSTISSTEHKLLQPSQGGQGRNDRDGARRFKPHRAQVGHSRQPAANAKAVAVQGQLLQGMGTGRDCLDTELMGLCWQLIPTRKPYVQLAQV